MTQPQTVEKYMIHTMLFSIILLIATVMVSLFVSLYKINTVDKKIDVLDEKINTIISVFSGVIDTRIEEVEL